MPTVTPTRQNDLTVTPYTYQMADTDRESFTFAVEANNVDGTVSLVTLNAATLTMTRLDTGEAPPGLATLAGVAGKIATVVVEGLTRGVTYELAVTMDRTDGRKRTLILILECVA